MQIEQKFLTPNKFSRPQTALARVNGIAIHYVGNPKSSALANRNYFESLKEQNASTTAGKYASSHYIVGIFGEVLQCIPENEIAYCTNQRNVDTIAIEFCHLDVTGKPSEATMNNLVQLCANLCVYYDLDPINQIIRHFDVTGKICPKWFVDNPKEWNTLKKSVKDIVDVEHVAKEPKPIEEKEELEKHWAYGDIKFCMDMGILSGYPDGSFRPDLSVSRAELAVVVKKIVEYLG